jgi:hypothetical protein
MAEELVPVQLIDEPEEALSPREQRLNRAARVLQWAAIVCGAFSVLLIVIGVIAAVSANSGLFSTLQQTLLIRYPGAADTAVAVLVLLTQLNLSLLLVMMVGVLAREIWVIPAMLILAVANIASIFILGFTPAVIALVAIVWALVIIAPELRAFRFNPVMLKELRGRMRGVRAFVVLTVYLGLMSAFMALLYLIALPANQISGSAAAGEIGRVLFAGVVGIELLLIIFIAPAFTAGAITGERERQTYDLLKTTLLPAPSFVLGKLESALSYVLLLLFAAIPLQSIAFLFGGVGELELVLAFIILLVTAITLGTVGIYFSTQASRTLSASVRAYSTTLVVTFAVPLILSIVLAIVTAPLRTMSPAVEAALVYVEDLLQSMNPITAALRARELLVEQQQLGFFSHILASDGSTIPRVSPWITFTIIYLVAATVLVVLSVRRMRKVEA